MIDARFSVTPDAFRERLGTLAAVAGLLVEEYAARASLDDLYLATACAAGDRDAWAECERKHFPFIRSFAQRLLPDADARDLADQVIADLWQRQSIARYSGRSTLRTWLGALVAHAAANARRAAKPRVPLSAVVAGRAAVDAAPDDASGERLLVELVTQAVEALTDDERFLLRLYYEQQLTLDEMEAVTRKSKATLSRRLKDIRVRLRNEVERLAEEHGGSAASIRDGLQLEKLELDLSSLLRPLEHVEGKVLRRV